MCEVGWQEGDLSPPPPTPGQGARADGAHAAARTPFLRVHLRRFGCEASVLVTFPRWNIGREWRPPFYLPAGRPVGSLPPSHPPRYGAAAFVQWPGDRAVLCSVVPRRSRKQRGQGMEKQQFGLQIGTLE